MPLLHPLFDQMSAPKLQAALAELAEAGTEGRGAIFTRREVVDFILDLTGYRTSEPLHTKRLLEPSMGVGDFLLPAIERLLSCFSRANDKGAEGFAALTRAVRAVEIHTTSYNVIRAELEPVLKASGFDKKERAALLDAWLVKGDFLLSPLEGGFDFVVGNPPYVRQELIPDALLAEYRRRFVTLFDRADIYIPFIERSLLLLAPGGALGFICADRWMKNRYGGPLRRMVSQGYRLKFYVDMVDTPAFLSDVIAYPAITVITKEKGDSTRIALRPTVSAEALSALAAHLADEGVPLSADVQEIRGVTRGDAPWVLDSSDQVALLRRLEADFPALEDARCKVGIGVATGADQVFIGPFDELDVEADRKLPLVMTRDILDGSVKWRGFGVVNPFRDDGGLVSLANYPKLASYLETHGQAIKARHVSQKNPVSWYRTIDRITPSLTYRPKLLIPDIKGEAHVVFEEGKLYPHHNLYFVISDEWDLKALRAVLLSDITRLFIVTYSTKMRGGYLRFQAQYLRRIRVPFWHSIPTDVQVALAKAGESGNPNECNTAAFRAFRLTTSERAALGGFVH